MVAFADLRRWDPAAIEEVFTALGAAGNRLRRLDDNMAVARTSPDAWQGAAADAARVTHDTIIARLGHLHDGLSAARAPVADAADRVTVLHAQLADLDEQAAATGFAIGVDGTLTDVRQTVVAVDRADAYRAERAQQQAQLTAAVRGLLTAGDDLDTALLAALNEATGTYADAAAAGSTGPAPVASEPAGTVLAGLDARLGATPADAPLPTDSRTPIPFLGAPDQGYAPSPAWGPLITLPAPVGPGVLGTPPAPDFGLDRARESDPAPDPEPDKPPFPPPQEITGRTAHGEQQVQSRDGHGVTDEAVADAVANPTEPPEYRSDQYGGTYEYLGVRATVHVNQAGQVVTAWANTRSAWRNP